MHNDGAVFRTQFCSFDNWLVKKKPRKRIIINQVKCDESCMAFFNFQGNKKTKSFKLGIYIFNNI